MKIDFLYSLCHGLSVNDKKVAFVLSLCFISNIKLSFSVEIFKHKPIHFNFNKTNYIISCSLKAYLLNARPNSHQAVSDWL